MRTTVLLAPLALLAGLLACTNEVEKTDPISPENRYDEEYYGTSKDTSVTGASTNVTFCSATLAGKINNVASVQKLPSGSTFGVLISSSTSNPQYGGTGVTEVRSTKKALVYTCQATGLNMGTIYYYRSFYRDAKTRIVYQGRVFAFQTETSSVTTLAPSKVGFISATVQGKSSVKINQSSFTGSYGVLFTDRQTDKPNAAVDKFYTGKVAANDSVVFEVNLEGLEPGKKYLYQAYLKIDTAYYYGSVMSFTTKSLTISDSDIPVDLGLSVRWGARNVGASSADLAGTYFPYGDPTGEMTSTDAKDYPNSDIVANSKYDMATVNLGVGWQLPTFEQFKELADECDWLWTTYKDAQGYAVMARDGSAAIFIPACGYANVPNSEGTREINGGQDIASPQGYYWTGNRSTVASSSAYALFFSAEKGANPYFTTYKYYGLPVRPVAE